MTTPAEIIQARGSAVVDNVARDEVGFSRWIKNLVATTIRDYRGRFLHELIQNGFDAHPEHARDGRIAVHFHEDEGLHGVLYVANGGRPLSKSNFEKMASLGDSDKPIGVGIGHKGVGFKSVFQVCDAPEVFSAADVDDPGFSGFTFRFGTKDDLARFPFVDEKVAEKVERELSLSLLTVPLDAIPAAIAALRAQGYVTVIRLPAHSARAASEIRERIDRLIASRSPVMLFLDRLESLSIRLSGEEEPIVLTRREEHEGPLTKVVLNDEERFLLFQAVVPHVDLQAALREAVDEGSLDESWLRWEEPASVSVAVGDGWMIPDPAPFTFLPMGETAASPMGGHVNAPFVTDFARLGLDPGQPLNRLLLQEISELCLSAAESLIALDGDANAVVDLLSWQPSDAHWLRESSGLHGLDVEQFIRLPAMNRVEWSSLTELCVWPKVDCSIVTARRVVSAASALLIDTGRIDGDRLRRLERVTSNLAPKPAALATWVEKVAADLLQGGADLKAWRGFYDDLASIFSAGEPLSEMRIILTKDMHLLPAARSTSTNPGSHTSSRRQRAVFFAPKAAGSDDDDAVESDVDVSPPDSLAKRLIFLHPDLDWYDGTEQTPGRRFLQTQGLARPFRTASLLAHLGHVMSGQTSDVVKRDALLFAHRLFANNPTKHSKELAAVGLSVPVAAGGWVGASRAHFSKGWPVDGAEQLSELASSAPDPDSEMAQILGRLLAEPSSVGAADATLDRWCSFLKVLGVTATLPINQTRDTRRISGRSLIAARITSGDAPSEIPQQVVMQWRQGVSSSGNYNHPDTPFTTMDPVCWFAGQHEVERLPTRIRRAYARLVMLTLPRLSAVHLRSTWSRDRPGGTPTVVETPLLAFLTTVAWVPVASPGDTERVFRAPDESWYVGVEDQMAAAYSPLIDPQLRRLMDPTPAGSRRWNEVGFLNWTDKDDAALLIDHLTELFRRQADIPETAGEHFRSSLAAGWTAIGNPAVTTRPLLEDVLLVEKSGQLGLLTREESNAGTLYVSSKADQSAGARLVRELGWPTVLVESSDPERLAEVARFLSSSWQDDVQETSEWELEVRVDGSAWQASEAAPHLTSEIPWLPLLLACVMRFPRASGMRVGRQLSRVLEDLGRIRLVGTVVSSSGVTRRPRCRGGRGDAGRR